MFGLGKPELLLITILFIVLITILFIGIPLINGLIKSVKNKELKTLVFAVTFVETFGFVICITIVLIPIGILLVLHAQHILVQIKTEKNTREMNVFLQKLVDKN